MFSKPNTPPSGLVTNPKASPIPAIADLRMTMVSLLRNAGLFCSFKPCAKSTLISRLETEPLGLSRINVTAFLDARLLKPPAANNAWLRGVLGGTETAPGRSTSPTMLTVILSGEKLAAARTPASRSLSNEALEKKIEDVKNEKNKVVKSQKFEEAASLRDTEKRLAEELEKAKNQWEEESKHKRYPIDEENIAEVVSMMTGIPVKRMVQAESEKLRNMSVDMEEMVVGQNEAIMKVVMAKTAAEFLRSPAGREGVLGSPVSSKPEGSSIASVAAQEAVEILAKRTHATGGLILLDRDGNPGFAFNTPRMAYGYVAEGGGFVIGV